METGFRGTFVMSWAQTDIDGKPNAPIAALGVGAAWSCTGEAVRVDGPRDVLMLGEAEGMTAMRQRAAASLRRLLGAAAAKCARPETADALRPPPETGFTVTDGRATWTLTLIRTGPGKPPLVMVVGEMPPSNVDLWVVSHSIERPDTRVRNVATGGVICFTPGTMILTDTGPRAVETLREGTRVQTKDNGCAEIMWIGARRVSGGRLYAMPHLAPIRLRAGALDRGVPDAGLLVSPDHGVILRGARAQALFNTDEVLVAARDLIDGRTVVVDRMVREVTYIHLLLPQHQVVFANAVETESFHPAGAALAAMQDTQVAQIMERLPDFAGDPHTYGSFARRVLSQSEAAILRYDMAA